jgi:hypothetical protein
VAISAVLISSAGTAAAATSSDPGAGPAPPKAQPNSIPPDDGTAYPPEISGYSEGDAYASPESVGTGYDGSYARCKTVHAFRQWKTVWGSLLWRYFQQIRFCYNGAIVTNFWRDRWAETYPVAGFSAWSFDGHIGTNCTYEHCYPGRWGHWYEYAWTQGKFHACVIWICNYKYPSVSITVYGNGTWTASTS